MKCVIAKQSSVKSKVSSAAIAALVASAVCLNADTVEEMKGRELNEVRKQEWHMFNTGAELVWFFGPVNEVEPAFPQKSYWQLKDRSSKDVVEKLSRLLKSVPRTQPEYVLDRSVVDRLQRHQYRTVAGGKDFFLYLTQREQRAPSDFVPRECERKEHWKHLFKFHFQDNIPFASFLRMPRRLRQSMASAADHARHLLTVEMQRLEAKGKTKRAAKIQDAIDRANVLRQSVQPFETAWERQENDYDPIVFK